MELKLEKKLKAKADKQASANFTIIFNINLKMALKNVGILITKLVYIFALIIILTLEVFLAIKSQDVDSLGTFKVTFYVVATILTVFYSMIITIYLLKKQWTDGIHSIESRAGFKPWKSYLIRALVQFTVMSISNASILLWAVIFQFISAANTEIYFAYAYSQVFFLVFLSIIVSLIILVIFAICNTLVGTMLSTVLMFFMAFSPLFASIKYMFAESSGVDYGLKMDAVNMFTRSSINDRNENVKALFNDKLNAEEKSTYVSQFNLNLKNFEEASNLAWEAKYLGLSQIPGMRIVSDNILNEKEYIAQYVWADMFFKTFSTGQFGYDWNYIQSSNADHAYVPQTNIFEKLPVYNVLNDVLTAVKTNRNKLTINSSTIVPAMFIESNSSMYKPEVIQINDFISELVKIIPEYSSLLNNINDIYNKLSVILNADSSQLFKTVRVKTYYNQPGYREFYSSSITYESSNNFYNSIKTLNFCTEGDEWEISCKPDVQTSNIEVEEIYRQYPELSIINYLIINLWFNSFVLDNEIDDLYAYYNATQSSKELTTDVYRHFGVMSTGIFANSLINDTFNSSRYMPISQGNTTSVKNILDYEKYTSDNVKEYSLQEPYIIKDKLKYTNSFIIPLAYFVYILISSPLAYIGYWFYERKTKI